MTMKIDVKRDVLFPSPGKHISPWALNPSYTSRDGFGMVMSLALNNSHGTGSKNWTKWTNVTQRLVSPDNGATWVNYGAPITNGSYESGDQHRVWHHFLDAENGLLLSIFQTTGPAPEKRTALFYEISRDATKTWGAARQIPLPALAESKSEIGVDQGPFARLDDGTIVFGFTVRTPNEPYGVGFIRGRWTRDNTGMDWEMGEVIRVPRTVSPVGVCEPDLLHLGGRRLLTTMRCQGAKNQGLSSTRQCALSEDGGKTWGAPWALKYDDGSMVCVPASLAAFEKDPKTGRAFWFANILSRLVYGQIPRYPLAIAELDTKRLCIIKNSVTVIQDLPKGAIAANEETGELGRRYSNFGHYVDRATGEIVLMMAEEPKVDWDDHTSDCIRFRVRLG
jgi:hypothetical protein